MKTKDILLFVITTLIINSCSQKIRMEQRYQDCVYQSLQENSDDYKKFMRGFESHLIELKILKNGKPQSYYNLYESLANKTRFPNEFAYSYVDSINSLGKNKIIPNNRKCMSEIRELPQFENSKWNEIGLALKDVRKSKDNILFAGLKTELNFLQPKDFKLDYYKHRTFMFLYLSQFGLKTESIYKVDDKND